MLMEFVFQNVNFVLQVKNLTDIVMLVLSMLEN